MLPYIVIASVIYWGAFTKTPKVFYTLGIIIITCFSAFRNIELGGFDALNYERIFMYTPPLQYITTENLFEDYSAGYILLNSLIRTFSSDYVDFQIVYVLITMGLLVTIFHKLNITYRDKCILLFSYFCFRFLWYEWVLLRQNLANLIFWLFAVLYYIERSKGSRLRYLYLVLAILVPTQFHTSAYLNIVLLPIALYLERTAMHIKRNIIPVLSVLIFAASTVIMHVVAPYITMFGDRYEHYSESAMTTDGSGNIVNYIMRMVFYITLLKNWDWDNYKYKNFILTFMIMVLLIGSINFSSANRVYEFYAIALYVTFSFSIDYYKNVLYRFGYWLMMLVIMVRFLNIGVGGTFLNYSVWFEI